MADAASNCVDVLQKKLDLFLLTRGIGTLFPTKQNTRWHLFRWALLFNKYLRDSIGDIGRTVNFIVRANGAHVSIGRDYCGVRRAIGEHCTLIGRILRKGM